MNWPWSRPREIVVTVRHEITGLEPIADALHALAKAQRYSAKSAAGRVVLPRKSEEPEDPVWTTFVEEHPNTDPAELDHMEAIYRILTNKDKVGDDERAQAVMLYSRWQKAGVGLPEIGGPSPV